MNILTLSAVAARTVLLEESTEIFRFLSGSFLVSMGVRMFSLFG